MPMMFLLLHFFFGFRMFLEFFQKSLGDFEGLSVDTWFLNLISRFLPEIAGGMN